MKKEIEILWELKTDIKRAVEILSEKSEKNTITVHDIYFYDPLREKLKYNSRLDHCLRLRVKKSKNHKINYITFKKDYFNNDTWIYSDEAETEVGSVSILKKIFKELGLKKLVEVFNKKYKFEIGNYEIVIEDVRNLGTFIEVEVIDASRVTDVKNEKEKIRKFLSNLDIKVGTEENAGKPELILEKKLLEDNINNAKNLDELSDIALKHLISLSKKGKIAQVCGPMTSGGYGRKKNIKIFLEAIKLLESRGLSVFNQIPFEIKIADYRNYYSNLHEFNNAIMNIFYKKLFNSSLITEAYFLKKWETSSGATWERQYINKNTNIKVKNL